MTFHILFATSVQIMEFKKHSLFNSEWCTTLLSFLLAYAYPCPKTGEEGCLTRSGVDDPGVERPLFWPLSHPSALFSYSPLNWHLPDEFAQLWWSRSPTGPKVWAGSGLGGIYTETCRHTRSQTSENFCEKTLMETARRRPASLLWNSMSYFIRTLEKVSANAAAINWHVWAMECLVGTWTKLEHLVESVFLGGINALSSTLLMSVQWKVKVWATMNWTFMSKSK